MTDAHTPAPTEGVTGSAQKPIQPTPVRGLEPVGWRARVRPDGAWLRLEQDYVSLRADDPAIEVEPLYSASDVSALQEEVERLRKVLERIRDEYLLNHTSKWARATATEALGEQQ